MKNLKRGRCLSFTFLFFVISCLFVIPFVHGNVFDYLGEGLASITGADVASSSTTVSITIGNDPPTIGNVSIASSWSVTVSGNTSVIFSFIATDPQGSNNINTTSATANFTKSGETTRYNDTSVIADSGGCVSEGAYGDASINFSCTIPVVYYDGTGTWTVDAFVEDLNDNTAQNSTQTFSLGQTTSFSLQVSAITFPSSVPGDTNVTPSTGGIYMNNTANDPIASGDINVTAVQIHGDSDGSTFIPAENFTISTVTGSDAECDFSSGDDVFRVDNKSILTTATTNSTIITSATLPVGIAGTNEETLFMCLLHVPNDLTSQVYSTDDEESWEIIIN